MLVLSRRAREEVIIDGCIKVTIVKIEGKRVRLGIDAPDEVAIHRSEIAPCCQDESAFCEGSRHVTC